jgi:hypothetical protein
MRAAQELHCSLTFGGGSAQPGVGGGGSQRNQVSLPSCPESTKTVPKRPVPSLIDLKIAEKVVFT